MNASTLLTRVVTALAREKLDTVLIGNAAAAMHGAPVTTLDFDFIFRDTPANLRKLKAVAAALGAVRVAALHDIIASKKAAGRERDLAVLPVLERTLEAMQSPPRRRGS